MSRIRLGDTVPSVPLERADGTDVTLEQFLDRPLVVAMPRYYG